MPTFEGVMMHKIQIVASWNMHKGEHHGSVCGSGDSILLWLMSTISNTLEWLLKVIHNVQVICIWRTTSREVHLRLFFAWTFSSSVLVYLESITRGGGNKKKLC